MLSASEPIDSLIIVSNEAYNSCVICIFKQDVTVMGSFEIKGKQRVKDVAAHTGLGCTCAVCVCWFT